MLASRWVGSSPPSMLFQLCRPIVQKGFGSLRPGPKTRWDPLQEGNLVFGKTIEVRAWGGTTFAVDGRTRPPDKEAYTCILSAPP